MDFSNMFLYQGSQLNCNVTLQNKELWQKFHQWDTEMIITKSGRRMFPALRVQLSNLDPKALYCVLIEMVPISKCRYKYSSSGGWTPAGAEEAQSPIRIYLHPESPATGHHWMSQAVSFGRVKLTNTTNPPREQIVLSSMHKYQPRIIIVKAASPSQIAWAPYMTVSFEETQFIAVTAYQNDKITKLKIDNNPFAKGFRENGQSKCKRKRLQQSEDQDAEIIVDDVEPNSKLATSEISSPPLSESGSERTTSPEIQHNFICQEQQHPFLQHPNMHSPWISSSYNHCIYNPAYYYNFIIPPPIYQNLNVEKVHPKKLTDFSIKTLIGLS